MSAASLRRQRALAQALHRPAGLDPADAVRRLLAVQAQDLRSARRALRARTRGATAAAVDRLLTQERSLVVTWLNRGTLHLVDAEDYPWLLGLTAPTTISANARRLRQEGVGEADAERGVAAITGALADAGPLPRAALVERLQAAGVPTGGQAFIHLMMLTGLRGLTVRGPVRTGAGQAFALTRDWLGVEPPRPPAGAARDRALGELARRYLTGHGPAGDHDLAAWAGLPLRDARRGLQQIAGELADAGDGLVELRARPQADPAARIGPRLLASFDPLLIGWKRRDLVVAPEHQRAHFTRNGILSPVTLVQGRAVGTWRQDRAGRVTLEPYAAPFTPAQEAALQRDAADLRRFEGIADPRRPHP